MLFDGEEQPHTLMHAGGEAATISMGMIVSRALPLFPLDEEDGLSARLPVFKHGQRPDSGSSSQSPFREKDGNRSLYSLRGSTASSDIGVGVAC